MYKTSPKQRNTYTSQAPYGETKVDFVLFHDNFFALSMINKETNLCKIKVILNRYKVLNTNKINQT